MRALIFLHVFLSFIFAVDIYDIKNWNDAGSYNRICSQSVRDFFLKTQDESIANIYANACLKMDKINELIIPMVMLYKTKESRENASLYSTILFQKKMLYLALIDGVDISYIRTPKVNYILSIVFDKYVTGDYKKNGEAYRMALNDKSYCDLLINDENGIKQLVVAIYKNDKLSSIKKYW
ncbi:hypothetical protein CUREO_0734 [Campylobacter ureolyticus RIGS 9880]|uniref:Uncharacterized protein n=1 Tax=Campylobacter ureolyticus RIGS 9880 TaxID=1032069 RepID=A0AAU8TYG2_9BACT|nr:hypothetical protein [Campylobacter ureolyticus]AKT90595.1 hypothetical protein CUREO_0734 [Campylobacter ureolyticus RIGS 9880]